jgi:hypothetical protein
MTWRVGWTFHLRCDEERGGGGGGRGGSPHLSLIASEAEPRGVFGDDDAGDALGTGASGAAHDEIDVREPGARDEGLGAVDDVVVGGGWVHHSLRHQRSSIAPAPYGIRSGTGSERTGAGKWIRDGRGPGSVRQ